MIKPSQLLNNSDLGWDVTKQPNPCLWKGVKCSGGSLITQLSLSGFGLSDSEFLSVVCNISSLQWLDVSENQLSSIIHEFIRNCGRTGVLELLNSSVNSTPDNTPRHFLIKLPSLANSNHHPFPSSVSSSPARLKT
ncbi:hypothetical protein Pint_07743 [Pistacia integerrima]|uniref:Uncharacterized protein n=1 Tax=Pistacia integerrima TaxID=434235 RepID=A0ACC0XUJ5_9ROSI|nr:hypothetical protein Pint_07743 [Pistacia integerrima]